MLELVHDKQSEGFETCRPSSSVSVYVSVHLLVQKHTYIEVSDWMSLNELMGQIRLCFNVTNSPKSRIGQKCSDVTRVIGPANTIIHTRW